MSQHLIIQFTLYHECRALIGYATHSLEYSLSIYIRDSWWRLRLLGFQVTVRLAQVD